MEVAIPASATDLNLDSACSTPYMSAPSSPKRLGASYYFSAPTSPSRASAAHDEFRSFSLENPASASAVPFDWEEKPGTPKIRGGRREAPSAEGEGGGEGEDFAFDFSGQLDPSYLTAAEELFEQGKIRPLKPPPRLQADAAAASSPKSPKSPKWVFSPRRRKEFDPFAAAMAAATGERGRDRAAPGQSTARRVARSLSPYRVSDLLDEPEEAQPGRRPNNSAAAAARPFPPPATPKAGSKKWSFKDLLLFRSASEGRAAGGKDPLRKYFALGKTKADDVKNSSFRSADGSGSGSGSGSMRRGRVSAHELHYTAKRTVSEEMRRKTFLPYRQGLLGCLGFNPTVGGLAKGLQSITGR